MKMSNFDRWVRLLFLLFITSFLETGFHNDKLAYAGIMSDAITHCNQMREAGNRDLELPEQFQIEFQKSINKAIEECDRLVQKEQENCKAAVKKLNQDHPKTLFEWNERHFHLVRLFSRNYRNRFQKYPFKLTLSNYKPLCPSQESEYCPVAVFEDLSEESLSIAFANHVFPLGVLLSEMIEFDERTGDSYDFFLHDISHAQTYLTKDIISYVTTVRGARSNEYESYSLGNANASPLTQGVFYEVTFFPRFLKYLKNRRKTQVEFTSTFKDFKGSYKGKTCAKAELFDDYFQLIHENLEDTLSLNQVCSKPANDPTELAMMKMYRSISNKNYVAQSDDQLEHIRGCFCEAWKKFKLPSI